MEKQILNLFINNVGQFVFWKDINSVYLGCNNAFAKRHGMNSSEDIIGKTDYDIGWSDEDAAFFQKTDKKVMDKGVPQINFEEKQTLDNEEVRWLSTSKVPLFNDTGDVIGILGWYIDISPHKKLEQQLSEKNKDIYEYNLQLQQSKKELEIANFDLEKFTFAASHDIQGHIVSILGFSRILKLQIEKSLEKKYVEYIDFILSSAQSMNFLVSDVLTYAKTGDQKLDASDIIISDLVDSKLKDLKYLIDHNSAEVNLDFDQLSIKCFPTLLGMVFYNLINNALKFNDSEVPVVNCSYKNDENFWVFSVCDNGIGLNSKNKTEIFEPFKRLSEDKYEGTGLGLSICRRIMVLHQGTIWCEDTPSGGTVFYFSVYKFL